MLTQQIYKRQVKSRIDWRFHVLIFIIAFAIVVSRRPDALFNAQFWAEDGRRWYADAYNLGFIRSLFSPDSGYLQTISRLTASFAQFFPLVWAPLIFNLVAIIIQILPVTFVTSSRFSVLIPSLPTRLFLAFLYLALPNSYEIDANLTNAQWHLALLACMVILAAPSQRPVWRFFDMGVILLSALSGPFSMVLVPIAALRWWLHRERWRFFLLLGLSTGALVQVLTIVRATRVPAPLGATPELFAKILGGQIFLGTLIGQKGYAWLISINAWNSSLAILVSIIGLFALLYALFNAPEELRLLIIFAALIFGTAIASPATGSTSPQWQVLWLPGVCGRYWFIPMVAFMTTLIWMLGIKSKQNLRMAATLALAIMFLGIALDWRYPAFTDFKFREHASKFVESPKGTKVTIPINPPGWSMELIKR